MNRFCHRRQRDGPVAVRVGPPRPIHKNEDYNCPSVFPPSEVYPSLPMTPPPPYELLDNTYGAPQPTAFYQQRYQSQQHLPQPQSKLQRKKRSAWTSTLDLSQPPTRQHRRQEQRGHSTTNLVAAPPHGALNECPITRTMIQAAAGFDNVAERLHDVLRRTDERDYSENNIEVLARDLSLDDARYRATPIEHERSAAGRQAEERSRGGIVNIQKAWMYSNSRLPPHMVPYKVYMSTWEIFCKAANASVAVYKRPRGPEREEYVEANWRRGTKAMVLKSTPLDDSNLIVIAIRGSQWNCVDWAVNFTVDPTPPVGFLDDEGNACHEGFLQVARSMIAPVAHRLKELVEQNPSRMESSLLFTGHSAGGAVANLLYMHMHSQTIESDLTPFNGVFKRIHCVTFGVPPISFLPLRNPSGRRYDRNIFASFINEGDPIVRADFKYMKSLVRLFATPAPKIPSSSRNKGLRQKVSRQALAGSGTQSTKHTMAPVWHVPDATLSNAGRLVLLREKPGESRSIEAVCCDDDQLRGKVFGDPVMHHMDVYKRRVEALAIASVTGRDKG